MTDHHSFIQRYTITPNWMNKGSNGTSELGSHEKPYKEHSFFQRLRIKQFDSAMKNMIEESLQSTRDLSSSPISRIFGPLIGYFSPTLQGTLETCVLARLRRCDEEMKSVTGRLSKRVMRWPTAASRPLPFGREQNGVVTRPYRSDAFFFPKTRVH